MRVKYQSDLSKILERHSSYKISFHTKGNREPQFCNRVKFLELANGNNNAMHISNDFQKYMIDLNDIQINKNGPVPLSTNLTYKDYIEK